MDVFKVTFESAIPLSCEIGWVNESMVVKIEGNDSQVAVDLVRDFVLSRRDGTCSPDAPVNTVKGFKLRGYNSD